jgi:hypothetical protein
MSEMPSGDGARLGGRLGDAEHLLATCGAEQEVDDQRQHHAGVTGQEQPLDPAARAQLAPVRPDADAGGARHHDETEVGEQAAHRVDMSEHALAGEEYEETQGEDCRHPPWARSLYCHRFASMVLAARSRKK